MRTDVAMLGFRENGKERIFEMSSVQKADFIKATGTGPVGRKSGTGVVRRD